MQRDKILRSSFFVFSTSLVISLTNVSILMQQMVTIFLPSSKVQMIYLVGVYFAYLPILVMIISVPISWNRFHKSSFSNETLMLGSGLALAVPLVAALDTAVGPMLCIIESNPRWGPNGNPERKLSHFRKWIFNPWRVRSEFDEHHREFRIELIISRVISKKWLLKDDNVMNL